MARFEKLFEPIKVGGVMLKNRLVMTSMGIAGSAVDGKPTLRLLNFLAERAKGGVGMVCTTLSFLPQTEERLHQIPEATDESLTPALHEMAEAVHKYGTPVAAQLTAPEIQGWRKDKNSPMEMVGPSDVVVRPKSPKPRPLTIDEIHILINQYAEAARRVRKAGFDAVEVLAGVGGIINRFMSPATNKREDEYGGSLENRMRLPREIIAAIKQKAGDDYTILWRWSAAEFVNGGYDLKGAKQIAPILEEAGVHWLNCQVGWHDSLVPLTTKEIPEGHWAYLAEEIKKVVSIPVVTCYRITDPITAERILQRGQADIIGMARALISDPEWPNKVKDGRLDEIRRCLCCMRCIDDAVGEEKPLDYCSVNPRLGPELDSTVQPAVTPKKVLVAGGGPAGLQAAVTAAERGHSVVLCEKGPRLGGAILLSSISNPLYMRLVDYLKVQLKKHHVETRVGTEVTSELIGKLNPDVVVLAVGGNPRTLDVPGIHGDNVVSTGDILSLLDGRVPIKSGIGRQFLWRMGSIFVKYLYSPTLIRWLLRFSFPYGKRVAIIGGGLPGCELAEVLLDRGRKVAILEESRRIGTDIGPSRRHLVISKFRESATLMQTQAKVLAITDKGIRVKRADSTEFLVDVDTIAVALGMEENRELAKRLEGKAMALYVIGDCADPRRMPEATKAGYQVGRDL